jgi:hypothetical protein
MLLSTYSEWRSVRLKRPATLGAIAITVGWAAAVWTSAQAGAKQDPAVSSKYAVPRTPDGHADLQGVWSFANLTPLERPSGLENKTELTDEEVANFVRQAIERNNNDKRFPGDVDKAYNDFWLDFGTRASNRTSLIIDPPDGRIPALSAEASKRMAERNERLEDDRRDKGRFTHASRLTELPLCDSPRPRPAPQLPTARMVAPHLPTVAPHLPTA